MIVFIQISSFYVRYEDKYRSTVYNVIHRGSKYRRFIDPCNKKNYTDRSTYKTVTILQILNCVLCCSFIRNNKHHKSAFYQKFPFFLLFGWDSIGKGSLFVRFHMRNRATFSAHFYLRGELWNQDDLSVQNYFDAVVYCVLKREIKIHNSV